MKGNWKRKVVASIAALTMLASSMTFTAVADSTSAESNSITKVYADIKGVDIVFENAVTSADYAKLAFEKLGGDAVEFETAVEDKILHLHFDEDIETDTGYKLTIGDKEKSVTVNKLFYEDFEDLSPVVSNSKIEGTDEMGKQWSFGGRFAKIGDSSAHGGTSKKAVFKDSTFGVSESLGTIEKTVTADIMLYNGATWDGSMSKTSINNDAKICVAGGTANYLSNYAMNIHKDGVDVGVYDYGVDGNGYGMIGTTKKTFKPVSGFTIGTASAPSVSLETGASNADWNAGIYTIDTVASEHTYTARTYDNVIGGYFDDDYVGTGLDSITPTERYSRSGLNTIYLERFSINPNWPGMVAVDNVLVTSCTVTDIVPNSVTKVYADTKGMDIVFENEVSGADYYDLAFAEIGGEAVEYTIQTEGNILHLHFNKDIKTGVTYKLTVDGENRAITVKELFFEDFEDNALSTRADAGAIKAKDRNGIDWSAAQGNNFCAILDGSKHGGEGHWLAITDSPFLINKHFDSPDMSINADVMMYKGFRMKNASEKMEYDIPTGQLFVRGSAYQNSYTTKIANGGTDVQVGVTNHAATNSYGLIDGFKAIKTNIVFGSITAPSVNAENPSNEDWAAMTYTIDSLASIYNYTGRVYSNIAAAYFENQYAGTFIDPVADRFTEKRSGLQSNAAGTMLIDNVLVTTCSVEDLKTVEITRAYADTNHFELHFAEDVVGDVINTSGITLKKRSTGEAVQLAPSDFVAYENTLRVNKDLERDVAYVLSIKKGFGTATVTAANDFDVVFTIKTLWYEDFESGTGADLVNNKIRIDTGKAAGYITIKNGKLYTAKGIAPMADELMTYEDATLTSTMSMYRQLGNSQFDSNYNKSIPYGYIAFNAKRASINDTNDLRWNTSNNATRQFGWYLMNSGQRRYHNWVDDVTVITPAEGSEYKAGDVISTYNIRKNNRYSPSSVNDDKNTKDGVGKIDYGQHYANTTHKAFVAGDGYYDTSKDTLTIYQKGDELFKTFNVGTREVTVSEHEAVPFDIAIEKQGSTGTLVFDGVPADTYKTAEESMTKGYFGISPDGQEIFGFEDMLITAYVVTETVNEVELIHADRYGVVLEGLKGNVQGNPEGVVIYDINEKKNLEIAGVESTGNSMFIDAELEIGKPYKVIVKKDSKIGDVIYTGNEYSEVFAIKEVLKVEPTIESLNQLNSGIKGPQEKMVVQGDGFVSLYTKTLYTPSYKNATIEADVAYYADKKGGLPYIDNYFNHSGKTAKFADEKKAETIAVGGFRIYISGDKSATIFAANSDAPIEKIDKTDTITDGSKVPFMRKEVATGITYGAYGCKLYSDNSNTDSDKSVWNGIIDAKDEVAPHTERYVMAGDAYQMYVNNSEVFSYSGKMNDTGYLQLGGSSRGLTRFYGLTVTQMEIVDKIALNVEDITADANEITVLFDQNVQGASDFSGVEVLENGVKVNAAFTTEANELNIVPEGGMKSGAVYSVKVSEGFGPSEICFTSEDASKNFRVTVYANVDFANGADENIVFDGVVNYIDGAAAFTNGSMVIGNAEMASASDYVVKYDYKHYAALKANGNYEIDTPASKVWFNGADEENKGSDYYWNIGATAIKAIAGGDVVETVEAVTKYGDAIVEGDGITLVAKDADIEDYKILVDGDPIMYSERDTVNYAFEVQKSDAGATLVRDGSVISTIDGTESSTTGYFGITATDNDVIVIDNIQAYTFEEITGVEVNIDVANGKAIVTNYGEEAVEMIVVVAVYNDNNGMISSFKSQPVTAGVGATEVPYTLESTAGAKVYKAFCWKNLTDLTPYCKAAVYNVR